MRRIVLASCLILSCSASAAAQRPPVDPPDFDGERCWGYLKSICDLGPRISGSEGMRRLQQWLTEHFTRLGGKVIAQTFEVRHPQDGSPVTLTNLIVQWHADRSDRILLCAHYDTRPFPDEEPDPERRRGPFIGANDGASGVAVLCELAHYMSDHPLPYGVEFVLFDGEEFVFDRDDAYFLGSEHFAREYVANRPDYQYRAGVLLDMVGDSDLQLFQEKNSLRYAPTVVRDIWESAQRLGIREFVPRAKYEIRDDHLALNQIARIPTVDLIDFDYPRPGRRTSYWHTQHDTPDKCSADSLRKVGTVVRYWLERLQ